MPLITVFLEVVWRVPNAPMFVVGFAIVGWALAAGLLAFTGSHRSGLPDFQIPRPSSAIPDEDATQSGAADTEDEPSA